MKLCPRCGWRKPDANFNNLYASRWQGNKKICTSCRQHRRTGRGMCRKGAETRGTQGEQIEPTKEDAKLIAFVRREKKKFENRGSPEVKRPYVYIAGNSQRGIPSRLFKGRG